MSINLPRRSILKFLVATLIALFSLSSFAQECASSLSQLRNLVGNPSLSTVWVEAAPKTGGPVTVRINGAGSLNISIEKVGDGLWMSGPATICKRGANYVANIGRGVTYGPRAPFGLNAVRSINIRLPYQSQMIVSAMGKSFTLNGR